MKLKNLTKINGKPLMIQNELYLKMFEMNEQEASVFLITEIRPLKINLNEESKRMKNKTNGGLR